LYQYEIIGGKETYLNNLSIKECKIIKIEWKTFKELKKLRVSLKKYIIFIGKRNKNHFNQDVQYIESQNKFNLKNFYGLI